MKDLAMPVICLAIGIAAGLVYPTQLHEFIGTVQAHLPAKTSKS